MKHLFEKSLMGLSFKIMRKIPVTVITGFLGSGKTTLVNRILTEDHGIRFAVIENEFGEIGIDQELVINEKEEIIEMNNGCICCTVRGDLIRIIKKLITSDRPPEHILIETTGLADPSPVAQTFLTDDEISRGTELDGIVTLVDGKHILQQLESTKEAKDQIAFADRIILNKIDLISAEEKKIVLDKIISINRFAKVLFTEKSNVKLDEIFNMGGFDVQKALEVNPQFLEIEYPFESSAVYNLKEGSYILKASPNEDEKRMKIMFGLASSNTEEYLIKAANPTSILFSLPPVDILPMSSIETRQDPQKLHINEINSLFNVKAPLNSNYAFYFEHTPEEFSLQLEDSHGNVVQPITTREFRHAHSHDEEVSSVGVELEGNLDPASFMYFIESLVRSFGNDLYRFKGILSVEGESKKVVLQGVHMLYEIKPNQEWKPEEKRKSTIIFIGKNLERTILTQGFISCKMQ
jgi:G3E family GTPase